MLKYVIYSYLYKNLKNQFNMRPLLSLILILAFMAGKTAKAQECEMYFPSKEGTQMQLKHFDKKDKLTGITKEKILSKTKVAGVTTVTIESEVSSAKNESQSKFNYEVKCENGVFVIDMRSYMGSLSQSGTNADTKIEATNLSIPSNPKTGDVLGDGQLVLSTNTGGAVNMSTSIKITNRKVEGFEDITCPAGTFKCVKISYDIEMNMLFRIKSKGIEWYSKNVGLVRSESLDKNGKLMGYMVLTELK
jgi:hypothetical protein